MVAGGDSMASGEDPLSMFEVKIEPGLSEDDTDEEGQTQRTLSGQWITHTHTLTVNLS